MSDYSSLKSRHRAERDEWSPNLSLRAHRALSWLARAEHAPWFVGDVGGQVLLDIIVLYSEDGYVEPPPGYWKVPYDLNRGALGGFVYLV